MITLKIAAIVVLLIAAEAAERAHSDGPKHFHVPEAPPPILTPRFATAVSTGGQLDPGWIYRTYQRVPSS